jgi:two-component system, chemotaxis family, CheB/CheR fusion protein
MKNTLSTAEASTEPKSQSQVVNEIFNLLKESSGVDFSQYAPLSVSRRLARGMSLFHTQSLEDLHERLKVSPSERDVLFQALLVTTTGFFREKNAFNALKQNVFPKLTQNRGSDSPIRISVAGCSSGEEAYSIAIAFREFTEKAGLEVPFRIFATDTSRGGHSKSARWNLSQENSRSDLQSAVRALFLIRWKFLSR